MFCKNVKSATTHPQGNIVYKKDDAQQTIFFNNSVVYPENTYEYDALYRLLKATGREHVIFNKNHICMMPNLQQVSKICFYLLGVDSV
ncbi:MAG: hypothetical protein JXL97_14660 [Bacteroidales bacterium]|nr:hypothetical protein [Bacteroidales bacterium]